MKLAIAAALACSLPLALAVAEHAPPRQPPPQAFEACKSARVGDACKVTFGDRSIDGTCAAFPDTSALVCKPAHPPGPPPEAIAACRGAAEGASCTVQLGDRTLTGTCARGPSTDQPLACRPEGGPPPRS